MIRTAIATTLAVLAAASAAACRVDAPVGSNRVELPDAAPPPAACRDQIDNDGDEVVDFPYDPGCVALSDDDETDPPAPPACSNGVDDDDDSIADFPLEPGCESAGDDDERDPAYPTECTDGRDNDGNGHTDYPDDTEQCYAAGDPYEVDVIE